MDTLNADNNEQFSGRGEIKQDISKQSYLHTWDVHRKTHFQLIVPRGNSAGGFTKVMDK